MTEFRFDGRTAVVTGAGGKPGLGRAYAMLLASRGASVVQAGASTTRDEDVKPYRS